jgi:hypothetical protein
MNQPITTFELFGAHYEHTGRGCKGCPFEDAPSCLLATFRPDRVFTETPCGFEWTSGQPHDRTRIEATAAKGPPDQYIESDGQLWAAWEV